MIEHFDKPVHERTPAEMCDHSLSIIDMLLAIPACEWNDGDIMLGQVAENVRQLVHAVPLDKIAEHRSGHPVDLTLWQGSR